MATIVEAPPVAPAAPSSRGGLWGWLTSVDHKKIGIMYGISAFVFFVLGGIEALVIRWQLAVPDGTLVNEEVYNQLFTMHGTTMVFLFVMPVSAAFGNYFMPIMIGARDVAFPRMNALSFWIFISGGIFISSSFFLGGFPDGAWVGYSPLSTQSEVIRMDFWAIGLLILGVASLLGAVNFITTIFTMRAPGMTLFRMPVFVWMQLVVAFLLAFSLPLVTVGLFQVILDRNFGTLFYDAATGGDPILWQHLFWLFGHPEVYILILPAMGIVSEVLPTFSRKPLFGYQFVVFAGAAIGFLGFGVWAHHMFTSGLGPVAETAFGLMTMTIAVPTGIKIFNWVGTMWGGNISFTTPMLFSVGFVAMFTIGGLSGVTHSIVPADTQQHDSYYVVAHFHYVLFGGAVFGVFAGVYYWFGKVFGRMLDETIGKWHYWLMFIGFNLTFAPMHFLGLNGMPRRIATYGDGLGWNYWNFMATVGSFVIALSILVFLYNAVRSYRSGELAGPDPWDGRTLEWTTSSPPADYNFAEVPVVEAIDDFWYKKYGEDEDHLPVRLDTNPLDPSALAPQEDFHVHLPSPSYYPILLAVGIVTLAYGFLWLPVGYLVMAAGLGIMLWAIFGWAMEDIDHPMGDNGHGEGHTDDGGGDDAEAELVGTSSEGAE
ncbi:MAG: cytochrome c oxidase subunit I [Acidimicrobiia bacterium]|nr:cytochrome c oxidase subunit I [Acidimicrobiia bacterium]MBT8247844.1 cytochrome c oxidase subunit I [Acidimicrobiia bacterium]NNL14695.1 cytochrome c oxidase subunit I [Acidimicrobiia bacterium]